MVINNYGFIPSDNLREVMAETLVLDIIRDSGLDLEKFKTRVLRPLGWKGQHRKIGTDRFEYPHLTKLRHKTYKCGVATMGEVKSKSENLDGLELIQPFSVDNIKLTRDKDFDEVWKKDIIYCFYDIEVTRKDAFTGFKLEGCKFKFIDLNKTFDFFRGLHLYYIQHNKILVFVAYMDTYDGSVIFEASRLENPTLRDLREISNEVMHTMTKRSKYKNDIAEKPMFNPLSTYMFTFDAMKDLIFQADSDEQFSKGGLKYNSAKKGRFYEYHIGSDLFEYNKTDIEFMERLFNEVGGDERVRMILKLFDLGGFSYTQSPCPISSKYALGVYIKHVFEKGYLREIFENVEVRLQYWEYKLKQFDIQENYLEKKPELFYSKNKQFVAVTGGVGGVHSVCDSCFLRSDKDMVVYDVDFASFYPSIMIDPDTEFIKKKAKEIISGLLEERLLAKKNGDKLKAEALKLFLNSMYGKMKAINTDHPSTASLVPLIAKCKIVSLIRVLSDLMVNENGELVGRIVDVNTDGVILSLPRSVDLKEALDKFTAGTVYKLETKVIKWILYKGIGTYVLLYEDGDRKYKGAWVEGSSLKLGGDGYAHNILNLGDMMFDYIEHGKIGLPIILEKFVPAGGSKENSEYKRVTDKLPFKFKNTVALRSAYLTSANKLPGVTKIDAEFSLQLIKNKLKQCKYPID